MEARPMSPVTSLSGNGQERQKGFIFLTLEDETGNSNVVVFRDFYDRNRMTVVRERFVRISGIVQNRDGVVHLMARSIAPLAVSAAEISSHDFH
jgi:error-prone DNA polymerase